MLTSGTDGAVVRCRDRSWKKEQDCAKGSRCVGMPGAFLVEQLCQKDSAEAR